MSEETRERLEALIEIDAEILTSLKTYFTAKRRAFFGHLYKAMETGSVEEQVLLKDIKTIPIEEKIKLLEWLLKNIKRAKEDVKKGFTPSWHYTIKVEKYTREIIIETKNMEKIDSLLTDLTALDESASLSELKEALSGIAEAEINVFNKIITAIKTETPERYGEWTPRIFDAINDVKEKLEELEAIKIGYYRVMKMRLYNAEPTKKRTPTPFAEIRAWFYTLDEGKKTTNERTKIILEDAVDRAEEVFQSLGKAEAVGNLFRRQEYEDQLLDPNEEQYDLKGSGENFEEEKIYYFAAFYRGKGAIPTRSPNDTPSTPRSEIYKYYYYNSKKIREYAEMLGISLRESVSG